MRLLRSEIWLVPKSNNIAAGVYKMLPQAKQCHQRIYKTIFSISCLSTAFTIDDEILPFRVILV